ncbi:MAG: hypothetical protein F6J94_06960 [Moorea sp. SIO1F2]|uniref:hypothetical protein n=1 Tax=Moorena sp. SIO1F2 TaxID=2607819 RepID=UPI0013BB4630|nr:hypothetical protein [Moorena sp. SIO1F2]NET81703.1 hypothetical protein [Moorena sp. SIO1F2]
MFRDRAKQVRLRLEQDNYRLVTSYFVLLEGADALTSVRFRHQTINLLNRLKGLAGLRVIEVSQNLI